MSILKRGSIYQLRRRVPRRVLYLDLPPGVLVLEPARREKADTSTFETLMAIDPDVAPHAIVADKGYDSKTNRATARQRRAVPVIPYRSTTKTIPKIFGKALYRGRAR